MTERNPAEVLPLCYRDSVHGLYAWRNRWQDENDCVISILTSRTQGFMGAKAENSMKVAAFGKKFDWGKVGGDVVYWNTSKRGESSVMTVRDGVSIGVDFTRASGAEGMLVSTGPAEGQTVKLGTVDVTFKFLTADKEPTVKVDGTHALVGKQKVSLNGRNLVFDVTTL